MASCLDFVILIETLGFRQSISLSTNEAHQELLGKSVADRLALLSLALSESMACPMLTLRTLAILEQFHALESSGSANQFV